MNLEEPQVRTTQWRPVADLMKCAKEACGTYVGNTYILHH